MMRIINHIANNTTLIDEHLSEISKSEYLERVSTIKDKELYASLVHGLYHSQKVGLFAFILANKCNLDEIDKQIIMDAAFYHDIGRDRDSLDEIHGYASAYRISNVIDNLIYDDEVNLNLLKAIVDNHSRNDEKTRSSFEFHFDYDRTGINEEVYERYLRLNNILKDADALDRNRFADGYSYGLDEKYLRLEESKDLIELSRMINELYTDLAMPDVIVEEIYEHIGDCYHSIGFDFFKIISCLEHGILSSSKLRELNLSGMRNFNGGNSRSWISVVDPCLVDDYTTAYNEFTRNGINFICKNQMLVAPLDNSERSKAVESGLPYDKSNHKDERYVYKEILPSSIDSIMISNETASKKVNELMFLYNSTDFRTFLLRINHYIISTDAEKYGYDKEGLERLLAEYKRITDDFISSRFANNFDYDTSKLLISLTTVKEEINKIIQQMVEVYYRDKLNIFDKDITVRDIVKYELSKTGKTFNEEETEDSIVFKAKEKVKID